MHFLSTTTKRGLFVQHSSRYSSPLSDTSRFTFQLKPILQFCWRAIYVAIVIAFIGKNVVAEVIARKALATPGLSAEKRYQLLLRAAEIFPFDRNLRLAPEGFRTEYNRIVRERSGQ